MFQLVIPGVPWITEKIAAIISGVEVMTQRIVNPTEASLRPVSSINPSTDFIVKWPAMARPINETASIVREVASSINDYAPSLAHAKRASLRDVNLDIRAQV